MIQRVAFVIPLVDDGNPSPAAIGISDYGRKMLQSVGQYCNEMVVLAHSCTGRIQVSTEMFGDKSVKIVRCWKPEALKSPLFLLSMLSTAVNMVKTICSEGSTHVHVEYDSSHAYGGTVGEPLIFALVMVKVLLGKKISVTTHCVWQVADIQKYVAETTGSKVASYLYSIYYRTVLRILFTTANSIITLTMHPHSKATEIMRNYAAKSKTFEVIHGIEKKPDLLQPIEPHESFTALVFGSIRPGKDFETALVAFAHFLKSTQDNGAKLVVAGSPGSSFKGNFASPYLLSLKELCRRLGIEENVFFDIRHLPQEDVDGMFRRSDVMLLLYKRRVGPSGIFAQAMKWGLPTIVNTDDKYATARSALPAVLIEASDPEVMARAVAEAMVKIKVDGRFRAELSASMQQYSQMYSYQKTGEQYAKIFTEAANKPRNLGC